MEALKNALVAYPGSNGDPETLDEAAQAWAAYTLRTHVGSLLRKSLAISAAIVDFTAALRNPDAD